MQGLNQLPDFEAEPSEFENKNRGRLVSKFLLSFIDENTLKTIHEGTGINNNGVN
jgi:hypothetical protein